MTSTVTPEQLARVFSGVLAEWLTADQQQEVLKLNQEQKNPSICHTHDFCDANEAMIEALGKHGVELDCQSDQQTRLIDAAWAIAKHNGFWFHTA